MIKACLIGFLVFVGSELWGQGTAVQVIDHSNNQPVAFAHLKVSNLRSGHTYVRSVDSLGKADLLVLNPSEITISAIGYKSFKDTIYPGNGKIIRLMPEDVSLSEIVVTGQYTPTSTDRSLFRVHVINELQIQSRTASDLAGLLRTQSNIRLSQDGDVGTGISLGGLSGENVKILIDGIPVIGRLNGVIDLSQINIQQARQIEIIEGPMSVIYGSNALAGVINIITHDTQKEPFTASTEGYYESVGVYNILGSAGFKKGKHGFKVYGGRNFFAGFSTSDETRFMDWKPKRQLNGGVDYSISLPKVRIKTGISLFDELLLNKGNLLPPYFERAFDHYYNTQRYTAKVTLSTTGSNNFKMDNSYSWYSRTRELFYNDLSMLQKTSVDKEETLFDAFLSRGVYTYTNKSGKTGFLTGYDLNTEWAEGKRTGNQVRNITDIALFLSSQLEPFYFLSLRPGIRLAYNSEYNIPIVHALHLKIIPFHKYTLRASWSSGFRAPSLKELYIDFVDVNHNINGNSNLKAESSQNVQVQLSRKLYGKKASGEVELSLFSNNIHHIITLAEISEGMYTYVNVDLFKSRGYNLSYRNFWNSGLSIRLGYGNTGTSSNTTNSNNNFMWSHEATSELTYTLPGKSSTISLFYKYTGSVPRYFVNDNEEVFKGVMEDYHILDITVGRSFLKDRINLSIGAKNLFDVTNIVSTGTLEGGNVHNSGETTGSVPVAWGRSLFIRLGIQIK